MNPPQLLKLSAYQVWCWWFVQSWVLTVRSIKHITRNLDQLLGLIVLPIMFLLLFRYVFAGAVNTGGSSYVNYLVAGILVQTLAFGASNSTINVTEDMQKGIVERLRSLPMSSSSLLIGHVLADLMRNMISATILLLVSLLVGFRPSANALEWVQILGLMLFFSFSFSWFSAVLGLLVNSFTAAQWLGFVIIMPLTFASSAFVPTATLPWALKIFAENQPFTHVIEAMRAWMVGTPIGNSGVLAFLWCLAITVISIPLSNLLFKLKTRQ